MIPLMDLSKASTYTPHNRKRINFKEVTMKQELRQQFLTNTDETGRFIVTSQRTGKTYAVEPLIGAHTPEWGDVDPATKKMTGKYGAKYSGGVKPEDSLITPENGFINVQILDKGTSPHHAIEVLDSKYPDK
jgi:hypothetical protein